MGDPPFTVRNAGARHVAAIRALAIAAWRDTYRGLLRPETIEAFLDAAYSEQRLGERIREDLFLVAVRGDRILAYADAIEQPDRVDLAAIYALPEFRGRGAGSALLDEILARLPGRPILADVLDGNRKGETFYEARGFEPVERLEGWLFGEPVVERRWRREPRGADSRRRQS